MACYTSASWLKQQANKIASNFTVSDYSLNQHVLQFQEEMNAGLDGSSIELSQIPTFVTQLPDGSQRVSYSQRIPFDKYLNVTGTLFIS
jgi:hexokinase